MKTAIKEFNEAMTRYKIGHKYNGIPSYAVPPANFKDTNANYLTHSIIEFLRLKGHFAGRTNTTGIYRSDLKKWIPSGATPGQADINAIIEGKSVQCEVKFGKDKLSDAQLRVMEQVRDAGGFYMVVRTFEEFINQYCKLTGKLRETIFQSGKYNEPKTVKPKREYIQRVIKN